MAEDSQADVLTVQPARRTSLPDQIKEQLVQLIIAKAFPDDRLPPERQLCEQLRVSRGPLREALSTLAHLGVIETRGKAKYGKPDRARTNLVAWTANSTREQELVTDPLEARRMLEPEVAALAAARASDLELDEILKWCRLLEAPSITPEQSTEYDSAFHVSIARATGNHTVVHLIAALTEASKESRELSFRPPDAGRQALTDHRVILQAIADRASDRARRAMAEHLDHVERLVRASLLAQPSLGD
jgi:GntR family transcriptional repressor for pyruvate dehydrogenase complex